MAVIKTTVWQAIVAIFNKWIFQFKFFGSTSDFASNTLWYMFFNSIASVQPFFSDFKSTFLRSTLFISFNQHFLFPSRRFIFVQRFTAQQLTAIATIKPLLKKVINNSVFTLTVRAHLYFLSAHIVCQDFSLQLFEQANPLSFTLSSVGIQRHISKQ